MVELRKRPPPKDSAVPSRPAKRGNNSGSGSGAGAGSGSKIKKMADKVKSALSGGPASTTTTAEREDDAPPQTESETGMVPEATGEGTGPTVPSAAPPAATAGEDAGVVGGGGGGGAGKVGVGSKIPLESGTGFGGVVVLNTGEETNLGALVAKSGAGVVVFTYPKASTPGCKWSLSLFLSETFFGS